MDFVSLFIRRPVATVLLAVGLALAGLGALVLLPISPMPNIDIPTIFVSASMAGASPETMSTSVATPLERHLGAIAYVDEMTSSSSVGSTNVTLQFDINRDIDGAARDVQAAINAARADLPAALRSNPTYRKINPSDFPIIILGLTSKTLTPGQMYDGASNILQQKLSQVNGVGDVSLNGASLPAIRIELNPRALFKYGIGLEDVRAAISSANAGSNSPKGAIEEGPLRLQIYANDNATEASAYKDLIVAYRNNAAVRLSDVADVSDSVENVRNMGIVNGQPGILVQVTKQPGANVIDVVDRIKAMLPELQSALPNAIDLSVISDTTISIRNSVTAVEQALALSTVLVVIVVFFFLRNLKATLIPAVSVPLSLLGTFGIMYLLGFSLDNFSLMALIVSTGFVVDNTIVVLENVTRHLEEGRGRMEAALLGSREVSFTVISMSISLVAVFFPILLLGGIVGKLFHEFAITITAAIAMSLIVSLTVTPMMCAYLDFGTKDDQSGMMAWSQRVFEKSQDFYRRTLGWSLDNPGTILFVLLVTVALNVYLLVIVPKGFFPTQDEGRMQGGLRGDQSVSFQLIQKKFVQFVNIIRSDPAVDTMGGFVGGGGGGPGGGGGASGNIFVTLKPVAQRDHLTTDQVIDRLRPKLAEVAGARIFLMGAQQIRAGGRQGNGNYQYTIQGDTLDDLNEWVPKITTALQDAPELEDVNSDNQNKGLEIDLKLDRATAARFGLNATQIDNTLYDAFGQRQVSTLYKDKNQYHVIMEVAPAFWQSPETLRDIYVSTSGNINGTQSTAGAGGAFTATANTAGTSTGTTGTTITTTASTADGPSTSGAAGSVSTSSAAADAQTAADAAADAVRNQQQNAITSTGKNGGSTGASVATQLETMVPLSAIASFGPGTTPVTVNHQGPFVATTFSFNLPQGEPISVATAAIQRTMARINVPISVHGEFAGTAKLFQSSLANLPLLFIAAIVTIYVVLGILYESYVHPLTILSTLPSAGVGAVLALLIFRTEFDLIAFIGVILLIGIVKKNAIIMIDFAVDAQRRENLDSREAIYRAAVMRFRPIMMTTLGAILGAMPLALGLGEGSELRQPLGISIVGGLLLSQALTLYTTPVVYLYLDRWRRKVKVNWDRWYHGVLGDDGSHPQPAE